MGMSQDQQDLPKRSYNEPSTREEKERKTEKGIGGQHHRVDRNEGAESQPVEGGGERYDISWMPDAVLPVR